MRNSRNYLTINEIFGPTIQGEGMYAGMPAIFIRFAGCNMACKFCDTEHDKVNMKMDPLQIVDYIRTMIDKEGVPPQYLIVLTGGEPLYQSRPALNWLVTSLAEFGYTTQLETNGTISGEGIAQVVDYISCSPKKPIPECKIDWSVVDCVKLLYPNQTKSMSPENVLNQLGKYEEDITFYLQPIDGVRGSLKNTITKVKKLGLPWRFGVQLHKIIGEK